MSKSPINVLQEIMIKQGHVPSYTCVACSNDLGTKFHCKVACNNLSASGIARNKKEAKLIAAQNMLSLIDQKELTSHLPLIDQKELTSHLPHQSEHKAVEKVEDVISKTHEVPYKNLQNDMGDSYKHSSSSITLNYVGMLQELCTRYKTSSLPMYSVIDNKGPCHMKTFTVEANIGLVREKGTAHCKRTAKQEAAKNLLDRLMDLNIFPINGDKKSPKRKSIENDLQKSFDTEISNNKTNETELSVARFNIMPEEMQPVYNEPITNNADTHNFADRNDYMNILPEPIRKSEVSLRTLEDDLRKLNIEISDVSTSESSLPIAELSEKAQSIYIASTSDYSGTQNTSIKNYHTLFKRMYSNKISDDLREKMRKVCELSDCRSELITEVRQEIQAALGVKLKQVEQYSNETGLIIICLRLLSKPIITQCGIGTNERDAENRAVCQIFSTILNFLK